MSSVLSAGYVDNEDQLLELRMWASGRAMECRTEMQRSFWRENWDRCRLDALRYDAVCALINERLEQLSISSVQS